MRKLFFLLIVCLLLYSCGGRGFKTTGEQPSTAPPIFASLDGQTGTAAEGTTFTTTVNFSSPTVADCTVFLKSGSSSTATYGSDWSLSTTSLSVTASATYAIFTVDSVDDTEYEANEDIVVEIDSTTCGGASSSDYSHTYTISSADSKPTATLSVSSSSVYEHGSDLTLTCTISHKSYQAGVCNLQKYSGTATEGTDFATLQNITVTAGSLTGTTTFNPTDDTSNEGSETVVISIPSVSGGIAHQSSNVTITINEYALRTQTLFTDSGNASTFANRDEFTNVKGAGAASTYAPFYYMNVHKAHAFKNSSDEYLSGKDTWIQIVDFNCDMGHYEFSGKTTDSYGSFTEDDSGNFHCNSVAGIAAANFANGSDSTDIMGVAYEANLYLTSAANSTGSANLESHGVAANNAAAAKSNIAAQNNSWVTADNTDSHANANLNYSEAKVFIDANTGVNAYQIGAALYFHNWNNAFQASEIEDENHESVTRYQNYITSLNNLQSAGAVIVFASGNYDGESDVSWYGALPELHSELAEAWLSVGWVEITGDIASNTVSLKGNKCGTAKEYCLVADGHEIRTAAYFDGTDSYYSNSGNGSSYAAPMISGSIALLKQAFPNHTAEQLTDRLLASANNSFFSPEGNTTFTAHGNGITHGYHSTWGHGIPDLYAALSPITTNLNPASSSSTNGLVISFGSNLSQQQARVQLSGTSFVPSYSFGDSLSSALSKETFYFYDALNGGFSYPILNLVSETKLSRDIKTLIVIDLSRLNFSINKPRKKINYNFHNIFSDIEILDSEFSLTLNAPNAALQNFNNQYIDEFNLFPHKNHFISNSQKGFGINQKLKISDKTLLFGYHNTKIHPDNVVSDDNLQNLSLSISGSNFFDSYTLIAGILLEEDSLLGAKGESAFSLHNSYNRSTYVGFNLEKQLLQDFYVKGLFFLGLSELNDLNNNFIVGADEIYSSSFGFQISKYDSFFSNDRLGFFLSQPQRIDQGNIKLKLPMLANSEGEMNFLYKDISLVPTGRQLDFGVDYVVLKNENTMFGFRGSFTQDVNHVASNKVESFITLSAKIRF